jgi:predicted DNA-binding transcriptional regulator YafY
MSINERFYKIDQLLSDRRSVSFKELLETLEVSPATLKRDLAYMRDRLNAPIVFDRDNGGYRFEKQSIGTQYELPGLWFSAEEIHALLTMQHLLINLDTGGLLGPHIKPLLSRLTSIIGSDEDELTEVEKRIKIEAVGARQFHLDQFQAVGSALLRRKRLMIDYHARGTDEVTRREVSPQRLIYYRDNWYLDAWCHLRNGLRSFSVDTIKRVDILEKNSEDVSEKKLNDVLGSGYGIFSGKDVTWATLHFTGQRARWVASERWHPNQKSKFLSDGTFELKIPFSDDRELLMDVLKHGAEVEIIEPPELRDKVASEINRMQLLYSTNKA